jgi:hypothetical protein
MHRSRGQTCAEQCGRTCAIHRGDGPRPAPVHDGRHAYVQYSITWPTGARTGSSRRSEMWRARGAPQLRALRVGVLHFPASRRESGKGRFAALGRRSTRTFGPAVARGNRGESESPSTCPDRREDPGPLLYPESLSERIRFREAGGLHRSRGCSRRIGQCGRSVTVLLRSTGSIGLLCGNRFAVPRKSSARLDPKCGESSYLGRLQPVRQQRGAT